MEEGTIVPQIDTNSSNKTNDIAPTVAALTGDTNADLAAIAREMGVKLDATGNVATTTAVPQPVPVKPSPVPVQAAPVQVEAPKEIEVPKKFQNADGTVNEPNLDKSLMSLDEKLAAFKAKEREYSQRQNKANNPPQEVRPTPQATQTPQNGLQLTPFERQAAIDILNDAAALGIQMSEQQAILQARADIRMSEAKYAAEQSSVAELKREFSEQRMTAELRDLLQADPDLASPRVADRVLEIKEQMGFKTYREAYIQHLGEEAIAQRTGQVKTPNPTGQVAKAPPTPIGPVSRVQPTVNLENPNALSNDQLEAAIRQAYPKYRGINK